jgi:hypothetical protein
MKLSDTEEHPGLSDLQLWKGDGYITNMKENPNIELQRNADWVDFYGSAF